MRDREPARHIRGLELMQKLPCWGGLEERQQRQTALRKQINVYQRLIVQLNHLNP